MGNLIVGVDNGEGPPVPIPNTEVKLTSAEDTCLETDWENRSMPTLLNEPDMTYTILGSPYSSLAQSVEHAAVNRRVVCSSQTGGASKARKWFHLRAFCYLFNYESPPCAGSHIDSMINYFNSLG